jgi:hypothetical protein
MSQPYPYAVPFRGLWACPCQAVWIPKFEAHCNRVISGFTGTLAIAQLIGLNPSSGDTHSKGGYGDYWLKGLMADRVVAEARQAGADPTWHREENWDGKGGGEHVHSGLRGCPHMSDAGKQQVYSVDHNDDGLAGTAPDSGPRPLSYRTWTEGIEWMEEQEMAQYEGQLALIIKQGEQSKARDVALRQIVKAQTEMLDALAEEVAQGDAEIKARITASRRKIEEAIVAADQT